MKPTLGHPSRIAAIQALRKAGKTEGQIAKRLGIRPNSVTSIECRARKREASARHRVQLSGCVHGDLAREAARRNLTADALADALLKAVVLDCLFDAVLDTPKGQSDD